VAAARKSRYGHRDATMILIATATGCVRPKSVICSGTRSSSTPGRLHARRSKRGTPSVHPIQGDELRALRRLQREQPPSPYVFGSERGDRAEKLSHTDFPAW
jgi:type 1 fimbriae regulatory protein FimB/type 1 fimbriae regulatory protein FimE